MLIRYAVGFIFRNSFSPTIPFRLFIQQRVYGYEITLLEQLVHAHQFDSYG